MNRLLGKTALITGGARGLGLAMAKAYLAEGAAVGIIDIDKEALAAAGKELAGHGDKVTLLEANLAVRAEVGAAVATITGKIGPVNVLVNNAAWTRYQQLHELDEETVDRMIAVGLKAVFWVTQAVAPAMIERKAGSIINISSIVAQTGLAYSLVYASIKSGLNGFTRALAVDLGRHGIRSNAIMPSAIPSEMSRGLLDPAGWEGRRRRTPLGRIGAESDVANTAVFLASDESAFITGEVMRVDGGYCIGGAIAGVDVPLRAE
ncbi:MAG: SDR family NAD(P)-dependent oxidoreductase [Burkholderiaceae bacterium]|nr:SDR family NAD(P)-dependent oxidoreductase [Burkholderiaceae bacterium]